MTAHFKKLIGKTLGGLIGMLLIGELCVRTLGFIDFPLYGKDETLGYWIKPNQAGAFMGKNAWAFNDKGMPIARNFKPTPRIDVSVIGNSIIMGGNSYDQKDKVSPLLQGTLGADFNIWPIAIGGWSNVNEAIYLDRHPEITAGTDLFVWEVMYGGFSAPAKWRSEYIFPTKAPTSALWYVIRRYFLPRIFNFEMSELPPTGSANQSNIDLIERQIQKLCKASGQKNPGLIFLYPNMAQLQSARAGKEWLPERQTVELLASKYKLMIVDMAENQQWTPNHYREGTHPTAQGNQIIAQTLADALRALRAQNMNMQQKTANPNASVDPTASLNAERKIIGQKQRMVATH
jgi:hypothetical protein